MNTPKNLIVWSCIAVMAIAAVGFAQTTPSARTVVDAAVKTAQAQDKNILVHFGASWCSWCRHLDALLMGPEFGKVFGENYVITHLTIQESDDKKALENPGAQAMVDDAGAAKSGVPVFLFLDKTGKTLATSKAMSDGSNIGHPVTPEEIKAFVGLLERTAPRMTAAQRTAIADHLSKKKY
jgi:thiol-disulfide isomerase/thioredoxin